MDEEPQKKHRAGPGRGVDKWVPTPKQRKIAELLFACGATIAQVALQLGVSGDRVKRHLRKEYEFGFELANLTLYGALWEKGVKKGDTACLIFLAKNRLGMMDRPPLLPSLHPNDSQPTRHEELCVHVTYRYSNDPAALPPPPPERLPGAQTVEAQAKAA